MEKNHSPVEFLFVKNRKRAPPAPALVIKRFAREIPPFQRPAALFLHGVFRKTAFLPGIGIFRLRCFSQARMPRFPGLLLSEDAALSGSAVFRGWAIPLRNSKKLI